MINFVPCPCLCRLLNSVSLDTPSGMDIVSCGEDGSVMVWSGTEAVQSIPHPASVWCAVAVPGTDGDFVTGGHDGILRYFSKDQAKLALADELLHAQFESQVGERVAGFERTNGIASISTFLFAVVDKQSSKN